MKTTNKVIAMLLAVTMFISMSSLTAHAAEVTAPIAESAPTGTKVFDGYNVTILDKTTPAVDMRGRTNDPNWMCFVAADDKEIGVIPYGEYTAIIEKNKKMIYYPNGSSLAAPPDGRESWNEWFADEFNKLRGLGAKSREEAVATETADTIEEYRQEVIRLVNVEREKAGLHAYIIDDGYMEYSQVRAEELMTSFSHTRPNGENAGYEVIHAGSQTPYDAVEKWMNSPPHKAAILNETRVYVGAGCYISSGGRTVWEMYFE